MELDPDEVEEVLRVTAIALGLPSLPEELCSSSYRLPIIGVLNREELFSSTLLQMSLEEPLLLQLEKNTILKIIYRDKTRSAANFTSLGMFLIFHCECLSSYCHT